MNWQDCQIQFDVTTPFLLVRCSCTASVEDHRLCGPCVARNQGLRCRAGTVCKRPRCGSQPLGRGICAPPSRHGGSSVVCISEYKASLATCTATHLRNGSASGNAGHSQGLALARPQQLVNNRGVRPSRSNGEARSDRSHPASSAEEGRFPTRGQADRYAEGETVMVSGSAADSLARASSRFQLPRTDCSP